MVRQARTYFAGAVSGVTLIGAAIALFVVLVSAQVFHQWPIAALSFGHDDSAVAPAKSLGGTAAQTAKATPTPATPAPTHVARTAPTTPKAAPTQTSHHRRHAEDRPAKAADVTGAAPVVEELPAATTGTESSPATTTSTPAPTSSSTGLSSSSAAPSNSSSGLNGGGGNAASASGSNGGATSGSTSSGGGATSSSGNSGAGTSSPTAPVTETVETVTKTPANVAAGVNETVHAVDEEVLGGALEETGVTKVTEGLVNGVAGPESVVGKTLNGVGETVNGLLGGGSH
jgi:hypothetical protein